MQPYIPTGRLRTYGFLRNSDFGCSDFGQSLYTKKDSHNIFCLVAGAAIVFKEFLIQGHCLAGTFWTETEKSKCHKGTHYFLIVIVYKMQRKRSRLGAVQKWQQPRRAGGGEVDTFGPLCMNEGPSTTGNLVWQRGGSKNLQICVTSLMDDP